MESIESGFIYLLMLGKMNSLMHVTTRKPDCEFIPHFQTYFQTSQETL